MYTRPYTRRHRKLILFLRFSLWYWWQFAGSQYLYNRTRQGAWWGSQVSCGQTTKTQPGAFSDQMRWVSVHMLPFLSHVGLYGYALSYILSENTCLCARMDVCLCMRSFWCKLWLLIKFFPLLQELYIFLVLKYTSLLSRSLIVSLRKTLQRLFGHHLECRTATEICANGKKGEQVKEQKGKEIQQFGGPCTFFLLNSWNCVTEKRKENALNQPFTYCQRLQNSAPAQNTCRGKWWQKVLMVLAVQRLQQLKSCWDLIQKQEMPVGS